MFLFDAPLQAKFHSASEGGSAYNLSEIFKNTLVACHASRAATIVSNHDTQPCQSLEAPVASWFKPLAYALILLRTQGLPCVFYADLYGARYRDKGKDGNLREIIIEPTEELEKLLMLRSQYAYGEQRDYFDHCNCIGWTRSGNSEHTLSGCAIAMSNGDAGFKAMEMGIRYAGHTFIDAVGRHSAEVKIDDYGVGEFYCNSGSVSVWIRE